MDIHDLLDSFIDRVSPRPARFLTRMWGDQQKAITYHELRDAILDGSLSLDYLSQWEQDYSVFLTECYGPIVDEAAKAAHEMLAAQYGGYLQDPMRGLMDNYVRDHGGRLIREVSEGQYMAINTLVRQATLTDTLTVDELARCIRPCIGLTQRQAQQCKRFYEQLREDGYSKNAALKKEANLAAKLHRRRAALIAQTEMAYAANEGMDAVIRQNVEQGIISPDVEKEWSTARDERVCPVCGGLHGEKVPENEPFSNGVMLPPAHPGCRCAVKYHLKPVAREAQEQKADLLGQTGEGYTEEQQEEIEQLIENADGPVRDLWEQNVSQLKPVVEDLPEGEGHFDPSDGCVHFQISDDVVGRIDQDPYSLRFHEYGHNIDWLNANGEKNYLSDTYRDPKTGMHLGEMVMQECRENVENYYNRNMKRYIQRYFELEDGPGGIGHLRSAEDMLMEWRNAKGLARRSEEYISLRDALRQADANGGLPALVDFFDKNPEIIQLGGGSYFAFDDAITNPTISIMKDFCDDVKAVYSWKERSDISDMFARYSQLHRGYDYPFGTGHAREYFKSEYESDEALIQWRDKEGNRRVAHETFAEMTSASVAQKDSLRVIQQFFPKSYQMYIDMVRSVLR